jgi:hypothetical protein
MAINKKLIHFKNKSKFNEELANNNINDTSICFIQDTQEIWTHGQLYHCASIPADQGTLAYAEYTGISTTAEVDTKSGYFPETLTEGASVAVKFEGNISHISTLNVNGTGAKNVYYKGNSLSGGSISRYNTYLFVYDGSYYRIVGVDADTHYTAKNVVTSSSTSKSNATATNGNVRLNLIENSAVRSTHKIVGAGATTVTSDSSGNITIDTPLKTINGESIVGSGDITIEGGGNVYTWSVSTDVTTGTVTPEEYAAIKEASQVYIEMEGVYYQALKMNADEHGSLILSVPIIMNDSTGTHVATGLCFEIFSDLTFSGSVFMVNIPTKTSQLTNDANFVTYANFEWDGSSEGIVTQEKFEELRNADIVIVKQQDMDMIAHTSKTSGGAVIFYYSTTMNNIISSAMFIVMDHDCSWTCSTSQTTIPAAVTEATVSGWGFTKNTGTYSKPSGGIPKTDLASAVQTSLGKADSALQSETYKGTVTSVTIEVLGGLNGGGTISAAEGSTGGTITISGATATNRGTLGVSALYSGDLKDYTYQDGAAAAAAHTHSQYATTGYVDEKVAESDPQIQADWDIYDSTSKAYIKNKPFGYTRVNVTEKGSYSASSPILWIEFQGKTYDIKNIPVGQYTEVQSGPPVIVAKTSDNTIEIQDPSNYIKSFPITVVTATPLAKEFIPGDFLDNRGVMDLITQTSADWAASEQFKVKNRTHYANFTSITAAGSYDLDELGIPDTVVVLYNDEYYTLHEGDNRISYGPPMLINLEDRTLTIDSSSYIDESYPLQIAYNFTKLPDAFLNHSYYCADFTLEDIKNKLSQGSSDVVIDYNALWKALQSDKLILIPYARKEDGCSGYIIPSAYVEDYVYMTIQAPACSNQFYLEIGEPTLDTWSITEVDTAATASVKFLDTNLDSIMELFANGESEITDIEVPSSISELLDLKNDDITTQSYIISGNSSIGEYSIPVFVRKEYLEGEGSAVHIHIMGASPSPNIYYTDAHNNNEYNYYLYIGHRDEFYAYRYKPSALGEYSKEVIALPDESVPIFSSEYLTLVPNVTYVFGEIEDLRIYDFDYSRPNCEYKFIFTTTDNAGSLMLPEFVLWANGTIPALQNNTTYELSIECTTLSDHIQPSFRAVLVSFKIPES